MAGKSSGGMRGALASGFIMILIAAIALTWVRVNDIKDINGGLEYFRSWGKKLNECGVDNVKWNCETTIDPETGKEITRPVKKNPESESEDKQEPYKQVDIMSPDFSILEAELQIFKDAIGRMGISEPIEFEGVAFDAKEWGRWDGNPCDMRQEMLIAHGEDVEVNRENGLCIVTSGKWKDKYTGEELTDLKKISVDSAISPRYAFKHGATDWKPEKKKRFANDLTQLFITSTEIAKEKEDKGPSEFMPNDEGFHCTYAKTWIATATNYGVSITEKDKAALEESLQKC